MIKLSGEVISPRQNLKITALLAISGHTLKEIDELAAKTL